ncbi:hypothetical protein [Pontiella sp.]|uniref:hypothetical protein n=1 Tax=Pontiella sp. TaxID=2837462 RepID=UPI0035697211
MKWFVVVGMVAALLIAGCKTMEKETLELSWDEQQAYLKKVQDPRVFGISIYSTPDGPKIRGGGRLHPERFEALEMQAEKPLRPLVEVKGNIGKGFPVLLDLTSRATWMEFGLAKELGARPVGEMQVAAVTMSENEVPAVLSVVSSLRLGQMFVEYPLVNVRMAFGSLGSINRGVSEGPVQAVIGWDVLKKFDRIQFNYSSGQVMLRTTTEVYKPNPARLVVTHPLVKDGGVCAVVGLMNGEEGNILIDPAGDFELAADRSVSTIQIGEGLEIISPITTRSVDGTVRIGARVLQAYQVTVCPKQGVIHFEMNQLKDEE